MNNHAPEIPRLVFPSTTTGAKGCGFPGHWNGSDMGILSLQHQIGTVVSVEARAKYNQVMRDNVHRIFFGLTIWSPNINIFAMAGRRGTFGEDPYLTSRMGVPFVILLQGDDPAILCTVATNTLPYIAARNRRATSSMWTFPREISKTLIFLRFVQQSQRHTRIL